MKHLLTRLERDRRDVHPQMGMLELTFTRVVVGILVQEVTKDETEEEGESAGLMKDGGEILDCSTFLI